MLHLLVLALAVFTSVTTELMPTAVLPAMSRDLGVSEGRLGLLVTAYALMVATLAAPLALATARMARRRLLVATLLGYGVCNLVTAVSTAYPVTFGARLLGGLCHGVFWGMLAGYAGRMVTADRVGRAVTIASMGGVAAVLLGVPAGNALGTVLGWRPVFGILAGLAVALAVVGRRILPDPPGSAAGAPMPMRSVWRLPGLAGVVGVTAASMMGVFAFMTYVVPFLTHAGVGGARMGPVLLLYGVGGAVGLALAGVVVDRFLRPAMIASSALLTGCFLVLTVAGGRTPVAVVTLAVIGVTMGCLPVLVQAAALRAAPEAADPASALNASGVQRGHLRRCVRRRADARLVGRGNPAGAGGGAGRMRPGHPAGRPPGRGQAARAGHPRRLTECCRSPYGPCLWASLPH